MTIMRVRIENLQRLLIIESFVILIMAIMLIANLGINVNPVYAEEMATGEKLIENNFDYEYGGVVVENVDTESIQTFDGTADLTTLGEGDKAIYSSIINPFGTPKEEEEQKDEPVFEETEITGNEDIDVDVLRNTLEEIAPALVGIEDAVIEIYETTGIKPSFQIAKFCYESGYGKSALAQNKNNIAGWGAYACNGMSAYEHAMEFETMGDCVLAVGTGIHENYIEQGRDSVYSIAQKYCPGNSENWANTIKSLMNRVDDTYASLM